MPRWHASWCADGPRPRRGARKRRGDRSRRGGLQPRSQSHFPAPGRRARSGPRIPSPPSSAFASKAPAQNQPGAQRLARFHRPARRAWPAAPRHHAHLPRIEYVERAWDDAKYGRPSQRPLLELTIPTMYDPSLAPPGKHIMGIFLQYAPYTLREGTWDDLREPFGDRVISLIEEYAPNIRAHGRAPPGADAARSGAPLRHYRRQHLPRRDEPRPDVRRCVPWPAGRATARRVEGLYLCGSGAHPGGGVMGAPGYNCAREMLRGN